MLENDRQAIEMVGYRKLVSIEKERSQRHNRFFIVFVIKSFGLSIENISVKIQEQLRRSDYIFPVENIFDYENSKCLPIGILLPETDFYGGEFVKKRLQRALALSDCSIQLGMAVYPDDSTNPDELIEIALESAKPIESELHGNGSANTKDLGT